MTSIIWSPTVRLPSPETVRQVNSSTIEWNPPYSSVNSESDIIHVVPHIIQYTVYGTDIYTGNIIVKENVTGTRFTSNPRGVPCTVSARSITAEVTVGFCVLHIHINNVSSQ